MNLADSYARFRGSSLFVWLLTVFLATWFAVHALTGFDHGYGILNVILSSEASLSVALLIMATEKQDVVQRKQLEYMLHMMEAMQSTPAIQKNAGGGGMVEVDHAREVRSMGEKV